MCDNDILSERDDFTPTPNYLRMSADIISEHVFQNSPDMTGDLSPNNLTDWEIRLAQFANGPEFRRVEFTSRQQNRFRMLGYNIYSEAFYNQVFSIALSRHGLVD